MLRWPSRPNGYVRKGKGRRPRCLAAAVSENGFGLCIVLKNEETHKNTSTSDLSYVYAELRTMHVLVKTNHFSGPECAVLSRTPKFPEILHTIHLPHPLICQRSYPTGSSHHPPEVFSPGEREIPFLHDLCGTAYITMHHSSPHY